MDLLIFRSIDLSIHPSIYLFIFVPIYLSTYPPIYSSIHPSVCPSIHLTILPIYLSQSFWPRQIATWPVRRITIRNDKYESLQDRSRHRSKGPGKWTHRCLFRAVRKDWQDQTASVRQCDTAPLCCQKKHTLTRKAKLLENEPVRKDTVACFRLRSGWSNPCATSPRKSWRCLRLAAKTFGDQKNPPGG